MKIQKTRIWAEVTGDQAVVYFLPTSVREMADVQKILDEIMDVSCNFDLKLMVINFARLRQMTSAFLSKLITMNRSLGQAGIKLRVCCMTAEVEEAFRICQLQKIIPLFATEDEALKG